MWMIRYERWLTLWKGFTQPISYRETTCTSANNDKVITLTQLGDLTLDIGMWCAQPGGQAHQRGRRQQTELGKRHLVRPLGSEGVMVMGHQILSRGADSMAFVGVRGWLAHCMTCQRLARLVDLS